MRVRSLAFLLCAVLALPMLAQIGPVFGQTDSISFHAIGVAVDFAFPLEAHPSDVITHNVTITAITDVVIQNITLFIYAPIGSVLQLVNASYVSLPYALRAGQKIPETGVIPVRITLPANTNGNLHCLLHVRTDQSSDYASVTFLTTQVRSISYGELAAKYGELLANHSKLVAEYENLLIEYSGLLAENAALISGQEALLNEYNALKANYTSLLKSQSDLQGEYDKLEESYEILLSENNDLKVDYDNLNKTCTSLEEEVASLEEVNSGLQKDINVYKMMVLAFTIAAVCLIALVVYVKRKKQEPYLVIRKETVSLGEDKKE